jgi:hypothetical protein
MTTTAQNRVPRVPHVPSGRYGLAQAARMEWIKLRSLPSTWWTLAATTAATIGITPRFLLLSIASVCQMRSWAHSYLPERAIGTTFRFKVSLRRITHRRIRQSTSLAHLAALQPGGRRNRRGLQPVSQPRAERSEPDLAASALE